MSDIQKMKKTSAMIDLVHKAKGSVIAPKEVLKKIEMLSPEAVLVLEDLMRNSKADSVRLKAALEVLAIAGVSKETKISIKTEHEMDDSELDSRLKELLSLAGSTVLEGEAKDVTPSRGGIAQPEEVTH